MTRIRNSAVVLDAARACVLDVGVRRTTLTDVARRAGVSRMTLYRRWPDIEALVADLMTRELLTVAGPLDAGADRAGLVARIVEVAEELRVNPLVRKIVDVDPELLLPYLLRRRGRSTDAILDRLVAAVGGAQDGGGVRPGDPGLLARFVLLAAQSYVLSARAVAGDAAPDALPVELATLLDRYLAA